MADLNGLWLNLLMPYFAYETVEGIERNFKAMSISSSDESRFKDNRSIDLSQDCVLRLRDGKCHKIGID